MWWPGGASVCPSVRWDRGEAQRKLKSVSLSAQGQALEATAGAEPNTSASPRSSPARLGPYGRENLNPGLEPRPELSRFPRLPHTASPPTLWGRSASRGSPRAVALEPPAVFSSPRAAGATLGDSADPRRRRRLEKGLRSTAWTRMRLSDSSWSHQACPRDSSPAPGAHGAALGP